MPAGACDCHTPVLGPPDRYSFDPGRSDTPGRASAEDLLAHQAGLGMERVVIVHPCPYGRDNTLTLDAVRQIGTGQARAAVMLVDHPARLHGFGG